MIDPARSRGLAHGITAYVMWGIVPIYWKLFGEVSPVEILAHRVFWGALSLVAIAQLAGVGPAVWAAFRQRRTVGMMALSGVLLTINWGTFIGAVAANRLVDASLGYFINPLISIALGTLVLREQLRPLQRIAIALAAIGVAYLTWQAGRLPWISLVVSLSFGSYGLVRKVARVESLVGSTVETILISPLAIGYLVFLAAHGQGGLGHASAPMQLLLFSTGVVTAVPLLLFNSATKKLPLSTIGFLQYIGPVCQLAIAVGLNGEHLARERLIAFSFIWAGLIAFSIDLVRASQLSRSGR